MRSVNQLAKLTRRHFMTTHASGVGGVALASLLGRTAGVAGASSRDARTDPLAPKSPHFAGKAKACIFIYLAGAPSQLELFNPKPKLKEMDGEVLPDSLTEGVRFAFIQRSAKLLGSKRTFSRHGESGMWFSDRLPHLAKHADDLCMIHSMHSEAFNHHPGQLLMCCGQQRFGLPSAGSWLTYGLGSESENLPGYVVLTAGPAARGGATLYSSGFLPSPYAGVLFRSRGEPVLNLDNPTGISAKIQRLSLDALTDLNRQRLQQQKDEEINSRIAAYELAFRMQSAAPDLIDLSGENQSTLDTYGVMREGVEGDFSRNCLLARRMVERGVRFINLFHGGWDAHGSLEGNIQQNTSVVDRPVAALLEDLKNRGLLDSTLVVWGTEFGRTPLVQGADGRDHHPHAYTIWLAGGGVRGGLTYGKSDDLGWQIEESPVHVNDFQATLLHLFGLDDKRLTYRYQGLDFRLTATGPSGKVIPELIA